MRPPNANLYFNNDRNAGEIIYPVLLRMMVTTAQIAVAIIRVSALTTINSIVLLADLLIILVKPLCLSVKCASVPIVRIVNQLNTECLMMLREVSNTTQKVLLTLGCFSELLLIIGSLLHKYFLSFKPG